MDIRWNLNHHGNGERKPTIGMGTRTEVAKILNENGGRGVGGMSLPRGYPLSSLIFWHGRATNKNSAFC